MDLRRCLAAALIALFACDDDEPEPRPTVPLPVMDASLDSDAPIDVPDTTCATSIGQQDFDEDGFSKLRGDCDDCDPMRGPASFDIADNGIDEDCDGKDAVAADLVCDSPLKDDETDAKDAVHALGLCRRAVSMYSGYWGLIDVAFSRLDGTDGLWDDRQLWLPEKFGTVLPREGSRMMALSTGVARDVKDEGYTKGCDAFTTTGVNPPMGFPRDSKACGRKPVSKEALAFDDVVMTMTLRAPMNATAFVFDSQFFTSEYPDFVCSQYNDFFVVLMDPAPKEADDDDNILFDSDDDAVGVNSALLSECRETNRTARDIACSAGAQLLKDTGFDRFESSCAPLKSGDADIGGASTGWLHTEMPVKPGRTFTLRFVLWDSGDPLLDSTVLIDNFRFVDQDANTGTRPITSG